jgi:hypothetical protein
MKKFNVSFVAKVDDTNNLLSSSKDSHEKDVHDLITDVIYDVDDMNIENLNVKERKRTALESIRLRQLALLYTLQHTRFCTQR